MKITDVETITLGNFPGLTGVKAPGLATPVAVFYEKQQRAYAWKRKSWSVVVQVETDEGIVGLGSVGVGASAAVPIIEEHLKNIVIGRSPFDVELLWEMMYRQTISYGRKGVALEAISAIDIALWDIMGKATGQPVYNLLGGKTRERIRCYASRLYGHERLEDLAGQAEEFLKQGFTAMKQRFPYGPRDGREGMRRNLELVKTVREVVGEDVELAAETHMGWDVPYAIEMARMLEPYHLAWIEEPVLPDDIEGYARIRSAVKTPISGGEHEFTRYGFRELISRRAVDILQPDVNRVGGITEARKVWALAAAEGLPVIPHAGQSHNYHLIMAHMNSPLAEYFPHPGSGPPDGNQLFWWIFEGEPKAKDGHVELSERPGLGLALNEETVAKYRLEV